MPDKSVRQSRPRESSKTRGERHSAQKEPSFEAIAILAVLLDPKTATGNKPGPAIRRAVELIRSVPHYLAPQFKDLSTEEMRRYLMERSTREKREDSGWNLDSPHHFTFSEAVNKDWCRHKTVKGLWAFMERYGYPSRHYPKLITSAAYQIAENKSKAAERELERLRKEKARSKNGEKQNRPRTKPHNFRTKTPDFRTKPE